MCCDASIWRYVLECNEMMQYHVVLTNWNAYFLWTRELFESEIKFVFIENFTLAPVGTVGIPF